MPRKSYWELLRDPRWQKRRLEIMSLAGFACEECGDTTTTFNVHHKIYRKGAMPWDYADHELICLCENCHGAETLVRRAINEAIARLGFYGLQRLLGFLEGEEAKDSVIFDAGDQRTDRIYKMPSKGYAHGFVTGISSTAPQGLPEAMVKRGTLDSKAIVILHEILTDPQDST